MLNYFDFSVVRNINSKTFDSSQNNETIENIFQKALRLLDTCQIIPTTDGLKLNRTNCSLCTKTTNCAKCSDIFDNRQRIQSYDLKKCLVDISKQIGKKQITMSKLANLSKLSSMKSNSSLTKLVEVSAKDSFVLEKFNDLRDRLIAIIYSWCGEEESLYQASIESMIKKHSRLFLCTTSVAGSKQLEDIRIERVFIEEAAQTIIMDSLIPITVHTKHLVLAGDPLQLNGLVMSDRAKKLGFDKSLMNYFEDIKKKHPKILLATQYRMHPEISAFPNKHFYDSQLIDSEYVRSRPNLTEVDLPPYKVINLVNSKEVMHNTVKSFCNYEEATYIYNMLKRIHTKNPSFDFKRITIISPYLGQVLLLKDILRVLPEVEQISSIDGIQGKENDILICSMVRVGSSVGFNNDVHRINVLLTRAKLCMYVVGNMSTFQNDPMWKALIKDAKDRRVFDTHKFSY
jgi:hypothetical protein